MPLQGCRRVSHYQSWYIWCPSGQDDEEAPVLPASTGQPPEMTSDMVVDDGENIVTVHDSNVGQIS